MRQEAANIRDLISVWLHSYLKTRWQKPEPLEKLWKTCQKLLRKKQNFFFAVSLSPRTKKILTKKGLMKAGNLRKYRQAGRQA